MEQTRKIIEINETLCNGCGACIISCAEGALKIVDGKARLIADKYCDGLGACLGDCPTGALNIIERKADEFDEAAVKRLMDTQGESVSGISDTLPCGCPSTHLQVFSPTKACRNNGGVGGEPTIPSALGHWPVQIRLVPAGASFLTNAELLIIADCTAVAYPNFHRDFLAGKVVLMGCPKFDDVQHYVNKFVEIFQKSKIKSITTLVMEVPCCQGLPVIVKKAMDLAARAIPMEYVVIGVQGDILKREQLVA